jgi:hypothetical protein
VDVFVQGATSSGAGNDGGDVILNTGNPGVGGSPGVLRFRSATGGEADPLAVLETLGANGDSVNFFVGDSDPSGSITGLAGSLFFRDNGSGANLYLNTSTASGTTWSEVVTQGNVPSTAVLAWGNDSVGSSTAVRVLDPGFEDRVAPLSSGTAFMELRSPVSGTVRNLYVRHNNPGGTGAVITYTLYVNGVASALTIGLASTSSDAQDTANSVSVSAGDRLRIEVTKGAAAGGGSRRAEVTVEVAA